MFDTEKFIKDNASELSLVAARLSEDLKMIRTNRPSVEFIENIRVNIYEQQMTIQQLGSISVQPPRDILINIWDKAAVGAVAKAIEDAKIGLSVSQDGNTIRASLPVLTDERKSELSKLVKKTVETTKILIRNYRDEAMKKIKLAEDKKELSEDQAFKTKEKMQKEVEQVNKKIENLMATKLEEFAF